MIENLELQKELSFEEVEHFFSFTKEFTVTKDPANGCVKIQLAVLKEVKFPNGIDNEPEYDYINLDTLIFRPTIQTLIRAIENLGYRKCAEVDNLEN